MREPFQLAYKAENTVTRPIGERNGRKNFTKSVVTQLDGTMTILKMPQIWTIFGLK